MCMQVLTNSWGGEGKLKAQGSGRPRQRGKTMKKISSYVILVLFAVLLSCFVACSNGSAENGTLKVRISSAVAKGLQAIPMDVVSYNITVKNSSEQEVSTGSCENSNYTVSVVPGSYSVVVEAVNEDGVVIGEGKASGFVVAGKSTLFSVVVRELEGIGSFSISIAADEGLSLCYKIEKTNGTCKEEGELVYSNGKYFVSVDIDNGFYKFSLLNGESVFKSDTVRIIKGKSVSYEATYSSVGSGSVLISDTIAKTPSIVLNLRANSVRQDRNLGASANISGIDGDYTSYWCLDGSPVTEKGSYADLDYPLDEYSVGEHEVSLFVECGDVVWSQSSSFIVTEFKPNFTVSQVPDGVDLENVTCLPTHYTVDDNAFSIIFRDETYCVVNYPSVLRDYYKSVYGVNPCSGNPFHYYCIYQLGIDSRDFVKAVGKGEIKELPYPDYSLPYTQPYIVTDESNITEEHVGWGIYTMNRVGDETGYFRTYETDEVFDFPETDKCYVGISKYSNGDICYYMLIPKEVGDVYDKKYPEKEYYYERIAAYFSEQYGFDVYDENKGLFYFSRDKIDAILAEYKRPQ